MRTTMCVAAALAVMTATTGCGHFEKKFNAYAYDLEVTGTAATSISWTPPPNNDKPDPAEERVQDPQLPWKETRVWEVQKTGMLTMRVTPKDGEATCRIVVEGKEAVKQTGKPGTELVCTATLKGIG